MPPSVQKYFFQNLTFWVDIQFVILLQSALLTERINGLYFQITQMSTSNGKFQKLFSGMGIKCEPTVSYFTVTSTATTPAWR